VVICDKEGLKRALPRNPGFVASAKPLRDGECGFSFQVGGCQLGAPLGWQESASAPTSACFPLGLPVSEGAGPPHRRGRSGIQLSWLAVEPGPSVRASTIDPAISADLCSRGRVGYGGHLPGAAFHLAVALQQAEPCSPSASFRLHPPAPGIRPSNGHSRWGVAFAT